MARRRRKILGVLLYIYILAISKIIDFGLLYIYIDIVVPHCIGERAQTWFLHYVANSSKAIFSNFAFGGQHLPWPRPTSTDMITQTTKVTRKELSIDLRRRLTPGSESMDRHRNSEHLFAESQYKFKDI